MIERERAKTVIKLALPIIGAMISTNLLTLVDTYMVSFLGETSLAAVGISGFASNLVLALVAGFSVGVQAITARRLGEGREDVLCLPLNGGLFLSLVVGGPITLLAWFLVPYFLPILVADPAVQAVGVPYMRYIVLCTVAVGLSCSFQGYWNGRGKPMYYMITLIITHIINVILNYALIFGNLGFPEMGVTGAAIASFSSLCLGVLIYFGFTLYKARGQSFLAGLPSRETLAGLLKLGLPSSIQRTLFWLGYTVFFWVVAHVGTTELAIGNVLVRLTLIIILPGMGMGLASATLVGQALGRGEPEDAQRWAWDVLKIGGIIGVILGLPLMIFPEAVLGFFHLNSPETLAVGRAATRLVGLTTPLFVCNFIFMHSLLGAGAAKRVMITSITCQWALFLPAVYLVGIVLGKGLFLIWVVQAFYGLILGFAYGIQWQMGSWKSIKL